MAPKFEEKTDLYEYKKFSIGANVTNYDVQANVAELLKRGPYGYVKITTDQQIDVRFQVATNNPITITSSESPYIMEAIAFSKIFITTGASGATVGLFITRI